MKKQIRMSTINDIKRYQMEIWYQEDEDCPNRHKIGAWEHQIDRLLEKDGITDKTLQHEVKSICDPWQNDCAEQLAIKGWKVMKGEKK